jgi:predicted nucleic acid-binding protein
MQHWRPLLAAQHGLRLVTRNVRDYADLGVEVINPWSE